MSSAVSSRPAPRAGVLAGVAACVTVVLWASAFVSIRSAGAAYSPGALALGRMLAGFVTLGALARTTASRMGATTYAVPALVVLMSWLALGEVPGLLTLAGGGLCLAGVAVSRSRARVVLEALPPDGPSR